MKWIYFLLVLGSTLTLKADLSEKMNPPINISTENYLVKTVLQGWFDVFHTSSLDSPLPGADFQEKGPIALYSTGIDFAPFNGVMEKESSRIPTEEEIKSVIHYFSTKKLPFVWWSSAKILESKEFLFGGTFSGIALDISQDLSFRSKGPSNLKIKIVHSEKDLKTFSTLAATVFELEPKAAEQWLQLNDCAMKRQNQLHFLAYLGEKSVGTVTLSTCDSSAGLWNLATLPDYRGQGIGTALVQAAIQEAKRLQYDQIMAMVLPEGMSLGLFTKMGFQVVYEFPFYVFLTSQE